MKKVEIVTKIKGFGSGKYKLINKGWDLYSKMQVNRCLINDFSPGFGGYNLAVVFLFGKDKVIRLCCSGYVTDAIYQVENRIDMMT